MLIINGVAVKTPAEFSVDISDIDGATTRNARGDLMRDRLAVKRKLSCSWNALTPAEASQILQAIENVFFTVSYPDPNTGTVITKTFYVGDRSTPMYRIKDGVPVWDGISFNLIER